MLVSHNEIKKITSPVRNILKHKEITTDVEQESFNYILL